jgi:Mediator of RNA pol II transcription subunit 19
VKEAPEKVDLTGATNLISHYGLEHTFNKFNSKKVKEQLSSFLPTLPCVIDGPGTIVSRIFEESQHPAEQPFESTCRTIAL